MIAAQTALFRLLMAFQKKDFVNYRNSCGNLNLRQCVAHGFSDMLSMGGCPSQDDAQTDHR